MPFGLRFALRWNEVRLLELKYGAPYNSKRVRYERQFGLRYGAHDAGALRTDRIFNNLGHADGFELKYGTRF